MLPPNQWIACAGRLGMTLEIAKTHTNGIFYSWFLLNDDAYVPPLPTALRNSDESSLGNN